MAKAGWCHRATYYRLCGLTPPKESKSYSLEYIFAEGHAIHAKWQRWLTEMGKLWGVWKCQCGEKWVGVSSGLDDCAGCWRKGRWSYAEVPLESTTLPLAGHADGAVPDISALIEIKSIGIGTLRFECPELLKDWTSTDGIVDTEGFWRALRRPLPAHVRQANVYLWLCQEMGLPYDRMVFLYEFKANQQTKEFVIPLSMDILNPLLAKAEEVRYAIASGDWAPDCPHGGCKECKSWEEVNGTNSSQSVGQSNVQDRRSESKSETGASETANSSSAQAGRFTDNSGRTYRVVRRRTDEAV